MHYPVELHFFSENHTENLDYILNDNQLAFVKPPSFALTRAQEKKGEEFPLTILFNKSPVGFLALDFGNDKLTLCENKHAVLLRSLSINPKFQAKGIAKIAMLQVKDFVKMHFPTCNEIVLSVNIRNKNAYQLYIKSGFVDTGRKILLKEEEFVLTKII